MGEGPPAPHQAATLKSSGLDGFEMHSRSPRASQDLSSKELQLLHDHTDGDEAESVEGDGASGQRNGSSEDGDVDDEGEEGLDDDMMDKISSSPSIDDGGYHRDPIPSAHFFASPAALSEHSGHSSGCSTCSSPYIAIPEHLPLPCSQQRGNMSEVHHHHRSGRYDGSQESFSNTQDRSSSLSTPLAEQSSSGSIFDDFRSCYEDLEPAENNNVGERYNLDSPSLLVDDPLLDNTFDSGSDPMQSDEDEINDIEDRPPSWAFQGYWPRLQLPSRSPLALPYEDHDSDEDDDTKDISFNDPRFIDSGWGGRCLRDLEDIDFEFVYALHTFTATVEGQANATKGDTMVLLDDSNSYWWLVRVVKDSSIGMVWNQIFYLQ